MRFRKKRVLLLIETSTSYGRDLLTGASRYARERNEWSFSIFPRGITEAPDYIRDWRGDGVIARTPDDRILKIIQSFACPVVELMYIAKPDVFCDERALVRLALDHFEEHCFAQVGFFSFGGAGWILERERQFVEECAVRGLVPSIFNTKFSRDDPTRDPLWNEKYNKPLRAWLREIPKPIAILAANDHQAVHLINQCNDLEYRIPDSIAILGINDDTHLCNILTPTLSSINQNAREIGYEAARLLDKKMNGEDCSGYEKRIMPFQTVTRQSTDSFATSDSDVAHALHFIREFATTGIRVSDVLHEVHLSNRTLERHFKESLGHTPEREIFLTKLQHAVWLLVSSSLPNHQISELSGFSNEQYFCKMFKREKGVTPQEYRRRNKRSDFVLDSRPLENDSV